MAIMSRAVLAAVIAVTVLVGLAQGKAFAQTPPSLDRATFADCTSPAVYSGLANGPHSFAVRANDEAGNVDASPAQYGWGVNVPSPPAPITPPPDVIFAGTSVAGGIARVVKASRDSG